METVKRHTESYLFENSEGQFRALPFYEFSIDEWVVFEKGKPKYLIDFNRRQKPLVKDIQTKLSNGENIEDIIWKLGRFLGKEWTTKHNILGKEILGSQQNEIVELIFLDNLSELFIDLTFVATENINFNILLNDQKLFDTYSTKNELLIESAFIDNFENLSLMLTLLFKGNFAFNKLTSNEDKDIYDLTTYKHNCMTVTEFEEKYQELIKLIQRENTMDEYGNIIGLINYIQKNNDKKHLLLITEKRKHWN